MMGELSDLQHNMNVRYEAVASVSPAVKLPFDTCCTWLAGVRHIAACDRSMSGRRLWPICSHSRSGRFRFTNRLTCARTIAVTRRGWFRRRACHSYEGLFRGTLTLKFGAAGMIFCEKHGNCPRNKISCGSSPKMSRKPHHSSAWGFNLGSETLTLGCGRHLGTERAHVRPFFVKDNMTDWLVSSL